jgi:hypothetical protein
LTTPFYLRNPHQRYQQALSKLLEISTWVDIFIEKFQQPRLVLHLCFGPQLAKNHWEETDHRMGLFLDFYVLFRFLQRRIHCVVLFTIKISWNFMPTISQKQTEDSLK